MQTCYKCKKLQKNTSFGKDNHTKTGLSNLCNTCKRFKSDAYRKTNKGRYAAVKRVAKLKKYNFNIDLNFYIELINRPCFYCGDILDLKTNSYFIDRLNSKLGYEKQNVVPCCSICNFMKQSLSQKDFENQCDKISLYKRKRPG